MDTQEQQQQGYVSIFDENRYEKSVSKQICTESAKKGKKQKQTDDDKQHSQKIDVNVIDYETPKKFFRLKTLQNLLLWFFCKNQVNPLWIIIHNKHLLTCGVVLMIKTNVNKFEQGLANGKLNFLNQFYKKEKMVYFRDTNENLENGNVWNSLFSSKMHEEPSFQGMTNQFKIDHTARVKHADQYQYVILSKFNSYVLSQDQLKSNLYPIKGMAAYKNYISYENNTQQQCLKALNIIAIDCEMVTTQEGLELARVSIVDYDFNILMDKLVMPNNQILDYNTKWSGLTEESLENVVTTLKEIQEELNTIINSETIIIGHSLENDLHALQIYHDRVIDTSVLYMTTSSRKLSLKSLALKFLNLNIQKDTHDSIEDAKIALALARHRIELLENFSLNSFQQNSSNYQPDVLLNLQKAGVVHVLDTEDNLSKMVKHQISLENQSLNFDQKIEKTVSLMKIRASGQQNPKITFVSLENDEKQEDNDQFFSKIDEGVKQIFEDAPRNTLILLNFENDRENQIQQSVCLNGNLNSFFMFIPK